MTRTRASQSYILSRIGIFFQCLFILYKQSYIGRTLRQWGKVLKTVFMESASFRFCARDGVLTRAFPKSKTYHWADRILNAGTGGARRLYKQPAFRESRCLGLLIRLGRRVWTCIGLLFFVFLIAPHAAWNNLYGFLGIFLLTLLFFVGCMPEKRKDKGLNTEQFGVYFVFYGLILLLSLLLSYHFGLSIRFFFFHMTCLLTVLLMVSSIRKTSQLKLVLGFVLAGVTIASIYGCYQGIVGVEISASQVDYSLDLNAGVPGRIYSFFDNPNNFAEILVTLMPFYLAFLAMLKGWWKKLIVLVCMVPSIVALAQTYSRSGWIGIAVAVLVFLAFQNWRLIPVFLIVVVACIPILPEGILNRILSIGNTEDSSTMYRFQIYDTLFPMFQDYWVGGVGLGSDAVQEVITTYPTQLLNQAYPIHSHNTYLQIWLECGIFGLLTFLGGTLRQFKEGIRSIVNPDCPKSLKYMMSAAIAGLAGVMVIALAEYTWFYPRVMFLFWFVLGVLMAGIHLAQMETSCKNHTAAPEGAMAAPGKGDATSIALFAETTFEREMEDILRSESGYEPDEFRYLEPEEEEK